MEEENAHEGKEKHEQCKKVIHITACIKLIESN